MRPSTKKRDKKIFDMWQSGKLPKEIMAQLGLSKHEYYKAIAREKKRR